MQMLFVILSSLAVFLTPFARSSEIAIIFLALCGLYVAAKKKRELIASRSIRLFSLLFLLLWLPIFFSAFDAVKPAIALELFGIYLRFYFFGIMVIYCLKCNLLTDKVLRFVAIALMIWIADALIQVVVGVDLLGYPIIPGRVNGLFGENLKLGLYLAVYSPVLMVFLSRCNKAYARLFCWIGLIVVVLLAGSRGGWIMFTISCCGYWSYMFLCEKKVRWIGLLASLVLFMSIGAVGYINVPSFSARVNQSMLVFSGDMSLIDTAISARLPIWGVAKRMFFAHPINGVGAKQFRYAYNEYALVDDQYANENGDGTGAMHAHNMIMDVGSETGLLGLMGLAVFCTVLVVVWCRAKRSQKIKAAPFAIGLLAALFPLNTHFAFYSGAWSQVIFWYTALFVATITSCDVLDEKRAIVNGR